MKATITKKPFIRYVHIYTYMQNDFIHIYTGSIINTVQKCLKRYQPTFYKLNRSLGEEKKQHTENKQFHKVTMHCESFKSMKFICCRFPCAMLLGEEKNFQGTYLEN